MSPEPGSYTALLWVVVIGITGAFSIVVGYLKSKLDANEARCTEDRKAAELERAHNRSATLAFAKVMLKVSEKLGCEYETDVLQSIGIASGPHPALSRQGIDNDKTRIFKDK